jgi:hypothetical protein
MLKVSGTGGRRSCTYVSFNRPHARQLFPLPRLPEEFSMRGFPLDFGVALGDMREDIHN